MNEKRGSKGAGAKLRRGRSCLLTRVDSEKINLPYVASFSKGRQWRTGRTREIVQKRKKEVLSYSRPITAGRNQLSSRTVYSRGRLSYPIYLSFDPENITHLSLYQAEPEDWSFEA